MTINTGDRVIVRSANAGVFAGTLQFRYGDEVTMTDARRIWYWSGAASLSELSQKGVGDPDNCKFPMEVPEVIVLGVCEILPLSAEADASIAAVPIWTAR